MASAKKTKPKLWDRIVSEVKAGSKGGNAGQWSARKAQLATARYKKAGGGYSGKKSASNSLSKWTKQDWGYVGEEGKSRYLPKAARKSLTKGQKAAGSRAKNKASKAGKQTASYTKAERRAVRKATR